MGTSLTAKHGTTFPMSPTPLATPLIPSAPSVVMRDSVQGVAARASARGGILTGYLPIAQAKMGCAEVWGQGPSLWLPVVEALGFTVQLAVYPASPWRSFMESYYTSVRFLEHAAPLQQHLQFSLWMGLRSHLRTQTF